ncbi:MAG: cytochrome C peroxidase [Oleispira sp.]|nr:cytochrome C peroxidase [Oleispira sp.]MBL4882508.1 cytochrome C peroxidase [Oleispira sp.]
MTQATIIHNLRNASSLVLKTSLNLGLGLGMAMTLTGCNIESKDDVVEQIEELLDEQLADPIATTPAATTPTTMLDIQLSQIITQLNLNQHPQRDLPDISEALPQLGKKLFFSKGLGGDFDSACVTCHHPALGGADQLSLPIGVDAEHADLLGRGRVHNNGLPEVPRNAPTVFNAGFWDRAMFHDSRVESLNFVAGTNGSNGNIRTPDSAFNTEDSNAGQNMAAAQARFPVTSPEEMRGTNFESGNSNEDVHNHLAARIGDYGEGASELGDNDWLVEFQQAFASNDSAENLISFNNIAHAIGEYERSMQFVDHPWQNYMDGDIASMTEQQKEGAVLFFSTPQDGGAGCAGCHNGQLFSDEQHHVVAFPQVGPGKGDGPGINGGAGDDDFGRARESSNDNDRYHFRTASLLNLKVTAPYGHSGSFDSLQRVVRHYINPQRSVEDYFDRNELCQLDQFEDLIESGSTSCASLYPNAGTNSQLAVAKLDQEQQAQTSRLGRIRLNDTEVDQLVSFLEALTDPCVESSDCLSDWVPTDNEAPDNHQLNAINQNGLRL